MVLALARPIPPQSAPRPLTHSTNPCRAASGGLLPRPRTRPAHRPAAAPGAAPTTPGLATPSPPSPADLEAREELALRSSDVAIYGIPRGEWLALDKPARYLGNEFGSVHKPWASADIRFSLTYPEVSRSHALYPPLAPAPPTHPAPPSIF